MTIWKLITRRKRESLLLLTFSVLPLLSSSGLLYLVIEYRQQIGESGFSYWFILFILLSVPIALSLIPNTLAGLLAGYFLGWAGLAGMLLSFSLACIWGFLLGRLADSDLLEEIEKNWPQVTRHISRFREQPFFLVSGLRLLPAPPFAIGSLILSWLRLPFIAYFFASIAGMIPRMALVVFSGSLAHNLENLIRQTTGNPHLYIIMLLTGLAGSLILFVKFRPQATGRKS